MSVKDALDGVIKRQAVVIGETGLCIACCNYLLLAGWKLLAVVSDDEQVQSWCQKSSVSVVKSEDYENLRERGYVLFSVINPHLISETILEKHQVSLALNYHDSLLPTYAGVQSTTWAIINQEKVHGVTWHQISSGIDEGDIVLQKVIIIEPNESAHSLNIKCTEACLELFQSLLSAIERDNLSVTNQDLSLKTYYGCSELPKYYGLVNHFKSYEEIARYARALDFGEGYDNAVATLKLIIQDQVYLVENPNLLRPKQKSSLLNLPSEGIRCVIGFDEIQFSVIKNSYGELIEYINTEEAHVLCRTGLKPTRKDWTHLKEIKAKERSYKYKLLKLAPSDHFQFDTTLPKKEEAVEVLGIVEAAHLTETQLIAAIACVLFRINQKDILLTCYHQTPVSSWLANLIDTKSFIPIVNEHSNQTCNEFEEFIESKRNEAITVTKDFLYRYQRMDLLTDVGVVCSNDRCDMKLPQKHRLVFHITPAGVEIKGVRRDKVLQGAIQRSLREVFRCYNEYKKNLTLIKDISLLSPREYQQIVYDWNQTDREYPKDKTIYQLFEEQVKKTPDKEALIFEDQSLSYRTLNEKSNQLARYLRQQYQEETGKNLQPDTLIVLCLERSLDMIIATLATLKAGAAYVPIDPNYPDERIRYILEDTKATLILTQSPLKEKLQSSLITHAGIQARLMTLDDEPYKEESSKNLNVYSTPQDLAYVIYTSGTTGKPKGVMVTQQSLNNLMVSQISLLGISAESRVLQFASFSFDAALSDIFVTIGCGAKLYILNNESRNNPHAIVEYIKDNQITTATLPPALLEVVEPKKLSCMKTLIIAGEACNQHTINNWIKRIRLINAYGPTEGTVCSTLRVYTSKDISTLIGKPIANIQAYILNKAMQPVPIGVIGELHIGGAGLARGYLNQPELTAAKFIPNPFATPSDSEKGYTRLYKTGDLVRWLPDGNIEYIGRNDFQVKIRGFRIELSEIEQALSEVVGVQQVCVLAKERDIHQSESNLNRTTRLETAGLHDPFCFCAIEVLSFNH
jgi:amino acid adenylation domain-containing protein